MNNEGRIDILLVDYVVVMRVLVALSSSQERKMARIERAGYDEGTKGGGGKIGRSRFHRMVAKMVKGRVSKKAQVL